MSSEMSAYFNITSFSDVTINQPGRTGKPHMPQDEPFLCRNRSATVKCFLAGRCITSLHLLHSTVIHREKITIAFIFLMPLAVWNHVPRFIYRIWLFIKFLKCQEYVPRNSGLKTIMNCPEIIVVCRIVCVLSFTKYCFTGDFRVKENPQLTIYHLIFVREHNRLVKELDKVNAGCWSQERLFQEARKINIASYQVEVKFDIE